MYPEHDCFRAILGNSDVCEVQACPGNLVRLCVTHREHSNSNFCFPSHVSVARLIVSS